MKGFEMKPEPLKGKNVWNDEDKLGEYYCEKIAQCNACSPKYEDDEGYGCDDRDDFVEAHYQKKVTSELPNEQIFFKKEDIKSAVEWLKEQYNKRGGDQNPGFNILVNEAFEDVIQNGN